MRKAELVATIIRETRKDPVWFSETILNENLWDLQKQILRSTFFNARTAVRSCNSGGKTRLASNAVLSFICAYPNCKILTTAPCYDDRTEILTDSGWKLFRDLTSVDLVAQRLENGALDYVQPEKYFDFPFNGELIGYKSQLIDFMVTPNHKMLVDDYKKPSPYEGGNFTPHLEEAQNVYNTYTRMSRDVKWVGEDTGIDEDWAEFLGYWFAEGSCTVDYVTRKYRISLTTKKDIEYAKSLCKRNGLKFHVYEKLPSAPLCSEGFVNIEIYDKKLAEEFIEYGKALTKRIPNSIRFATQDIINAFLNGYLKGDGCIDENGSIKLCTSSAGLAGDLQELYMKIGYAANDSIMKSNINGPFKENAPEHIVSVWVNRGLYPETKKDNRSDNYNGWYKQEYHGRVYCVKVPTGVIMVRRNGKPLWSGNTLIQVEKLLWGDIAQLYKKFPKDFGFELLQTELRVPGNKNWWALGLTTNEGVRFFGHHAPKMLIIVDEAPGVDDEIFAAIDSLRASGDVHLLLLGNPFIVSGRFYEVFTVKREGWHLFHIDAFETPNFEGITEENLLNINLSEDVSVDNKYPYLVTKQWVKERLQEWGLESPYYKALVHGEFPEQTEDSLFNLSWLTKAHSILQKTSYQDIPVQYPIDQNELISIGIDVAGPGDNETVVYIRQFKNILCMRTFNEIGAVIAFIKNFYPSLKGKINVDVVGIGYYFYTQIDDAFPVWEVQDINVGEAVRDKEKYYNLKAFAYWKLREKFSTFYIQGLTDENTISQLSTMKYDHTPKGQIKIESKKEARSRGLKSPDRAEALMLAFYDPDPALDFSGEAPKGFSDNRTSIGLFR